LNVFSLKIPLILTILDINPLSLKKKDLIDQRDLLIREEKDTVMIKDQDKDSMM
jgi:hypothetical protein